MVIRKCIYLSVYIAIYLQTLSIHTSEILLKYRIYNNIVKYTLQIRLNNSSYKLVNNVKKFLIKSIKNWKIYFRLCSALKKCSLLITIFNFNKISSLFPSFFVRLKH